MIKINLILKNIFFHHILFNFVTNTILKNNIKRGDTYSVDGNLGFEFNITLKSFFSIIGSFCVII